MAGETVGGRTKIAHRLLLCSTLGAASILGVASTAFAAAHAGPRISKSVAGFDIPATNKAGVVWTLYLRHQGQVVGTDAGTSGTLTVTVPSSVHGMVQADVRRNSHWYSGNRFLIPNSGTGGGGGGTTTTTSTTTTTTTTTTSATGPSLKAASGGATAIPGYVPPVPVTLVTQPETKASGSALAFTGAGATLWMAALAGVGFVLSGAYLVGRRPQVRVVRSLETLIRPRD